MQLMDIIFIGLLGLLALRGLLRGFSGELLSIASLVLALMAAVFLLSNVAAFIRLHYLQISLVPEILAFVAIFLVVFIAGKIIEKIIKDIIDRLNLGGLDKALGLILGLAEGIAIMVLVLFLLIIQPFFDPSELLGKSFFASLILPIIGVFHV